MNYLRGECSNVEFKESFSTDAIRTLVAFANGYNRVPAGYMLIGVDKTGGMTGLKNDPDAVQRDVSDARTRKTQTTTAVNNTLIRKRLCVLRYAYVKTKNPANARIIFNPELD